MKNLLEFETTQLNERKKHSPSVEYVTTLLCVYICVELSEAFQFSKIHSVVIMPKYYCDYCDTFLTHDSVSLKIILQGSQSNFVILSAFGAQNPLQRAKAQGKCALLLPKVDGGAGPEFDRCYE